MATVIHLRGSPSSRASATTAPVAASGACTANAEARDVRAVRLEELARPFLSSPRLSADDPLRAGIQYFLAEALARRDFHPNQVLRRLEDAVACRNTNTAECLICALQGLVLLEAHPAGLQQLGGRIWMLDPARNGFRAQLQNPESNSQEYERRRNDFDRQVAHDAAYAVAQVLRGLPA